MSTLETIAAQEDAAVMRDLQHSLHWKVLRRCLENAIARVTERTLTGSAEQFDFNKGNVMGLREALHLPEALIAHAEKLARAGGTR